MSSLLTTRSAKALRVAAIAALVAAPLVSSPAEARAGGGFSFGSRGSRSFSMPAPTPTMPRAAPFQSSDMARMRPGMTAAQPRRFGFGSGLLAGLLGAGLFGLFTGGGFLGGIAALFGLVFKLALIGGVIWLVLRVFRGVRPATAAGPGLPGGAMARDGGPLPGSARAQSVPFQPQPADFDAFERALGAVQEAYSREDLPALSRLATPEVVRQLAGDLDANRRQGRRNDVSAVRLLQGDLSEAWREGSAAYATVAMRFAAVDVMLDRASGRIVAGDPVRPVEAAELWTFRREGLGPWLLSGIQQAG